MGLLPERGALPDTLDIEVGRRLTRSIELLGVALSGIGQAIRASSRTSSNPAFQSRNTCVYVCNPSLLRLSRDIRTVEPYLDAPLDI